MKKSRRKKNASRAK